jgi:hypothetical protein
MEASIAKFPLTPHGRLTKKAKAAKDFVKRRAGLAREILGIVIMDASNFHRIIAYKNGGRGTTNLLEVIPMVECLAQKRSKHQAAKQATAVTWQLFGWCNASRTKSQRNCRIKPLYEAGHGGDLTVIRTGICLARKTSNELVSEYAEL